MINVSVGRQLFIDRGFLTNDTANVSLIYHPGTYEPHLNPLLDNTTAPKTTEASTFSGGVWHIGGAFHMWYKCAGHVTCYANSSDGLHWQKPPIGPNGTNAVRGAEPHDTSTIWYDRAEPDASRRFKMSETRAPGVDAFTISTSADGLDWRVVKNRSGPVLDRSTIFYNPFRRRWVFSNKVIGPVALGRARAYLESHGPSLCNWTPDGGCRADDLAWTKAFDERAAGEPRPWTGADSTDLC